MLIADKILDEIIFVLSTFESYIRHRSKLSLTDANISAESLVADLLNALHGWGLNNTNAAISNYPCIDLIDEKNRVGVQVTATTTLKKIKSTINCIERHEFHSKIDRLIIFMLLSRQSNYSVLPPRNIKFSTTDDIIDFHTIIRYAKHSVDRSEVLSNIRAIIRGHISSRLPCFNSEVDNLIIIEMEARAKNLTESSIQLEIFNLIKGGQKELAKVRLDDWAKQIYTNASAEIYSLAELYALVNPVEAELHYQRALEMNPGNIKHANIRGLNLMKIGRLNEAEKLFKSCLASADLSPADKEHILGNLGVLCKNRARWPEAIDYLKQALAVPRPVINLEKVNHLNNLASCYNNIANYEDSEILLDEAYYLIDVLIEEQDDIDRKNMLKLKKSNILTNISIRLRHEASRDNDDTLLSKAIDVVKEAVDIAELLKEKTELTRHYGNLSNIYSQMKNYEKARNFLEKSLALAVENQDHRSEVANLVNLGLLQINEQQFPDAERTLQHGLKKENNLYPHLRAHLYANLAIVTKLMKKYEESALFFSEAERLYIKHNMRSHLKDLGDSISQRESSVR
ncbi:SMEK domain-containing protein [Pseudomonas paraeruginosa]|uniref:SMEK domain-containing protein n=1 Tax=Pseudomonas paraeruginosa TaxID=2994495 RepID=UPI0039FD54B3